MAIRPIFISCFSSPFFVKKDIEFEYHSGLSYSQKRKNVEELHKVVYAKLPNNKILEVSSKSTTDIGVKLSAFNLKNRDGVSVECLFQASKVFTNGGPYIDLLYKTSYEAKTDMRIRNSGDLIHFHLLDKDYPIIPTTSFYDWLYIHTLYCHNKELVNELVRYDTFSDIEFNPKKSVNCQAEAIAIFVGLYNQGVMQDIVSNYDLFVEYVFKNGTFDNKQISLFYVV